MTLRENQVAFAKDSIKLYQFILENGFEFTYGETLRTPEQQAIYLKEGKSKTSNSRHLIKCAVDLNIFKDGSLITTKDMLQAIGDFWETLSDRNKWGGNYVGFLDTPHFERLPIY